MSAEEPDGRGRPVCGEDLAAMRAELEAYRKLAGEFESLSIGHQERLVEECKRFEKQLNGDNSWYIATFDVGIGTALKAAQDALENNQ